jgi:hypothetical protein
MFSNTKFLARLRVVAMAGLLVMGVWQTEGDAAWTKIIIPGTKSISSVAVADSILFASTDSGVFRSTNNGNVWQKVTGLTSFSKIEGNNTTLFTLGQGSIDFSSDYGVSWNKLNSPDPAFFAIQSPSSFCVQDNKILFFLGQTPFLSENNGLSWTILNSIPVSGTTLNGCCLLGNLLFSSEIAGGVYSSRDLGHSWNESNYGIYGPNIFVLHGLVTKGSYLYVLGHNPKTCVFCSIDSGYTWKSMGLKNDYEPQDISFSKTSVFVGADSGIYAAQLDSLNWTDVSVPANRATRWIAIDTEYLYAIAGQDSYMEIDTLFRRPLSEVNALLKQKMPGPQKSISTNFVIDHLTSQHALGITFSPGRTEKASLKVYSAAGKAVATLFEGATRSGENRVTWDYRNVPSGIYCIRLESENGKAVKKVQVMR